MGEPCAPNRRIIDEGAADLLVVTPTFGTLGFGGDDFVWIGATDEGF
jgi:hypothetical protein